MKRTDTVFTGSIADLYQRLLVPLIFADYAEILAERIAATGPRHLLETAAGTGALTRPLLAKLPEATIVATDLNAAMLDCARGLSNAARVKWQQANACALPFDDGAFDAVACQFGVMFFPDKVQAYREALRVLNPGGRFFFSVWDHIETSDIPHVVTEALAQRFPHDPPRFMARTPHGYHDLEVIGAHLRDAGARRIQVDTVPLPCRAASAREAAVAFCHGTPLRNEIEALDPAGLEAATEAAAEALTDHFGSGPIEGSMQAHLIIASR